MRVNVPVVAVAVGRVDREMRRVALPLKLLADKVLHQAAVLFERLLVRQSDVEVHRQLRIAALLEALHLVDQLAEVARPIRRILRRINARRQRRAEVRVIPHLAGTLIDQLGAVVVGGGAHEALSLAPADVRMHAQVIARQALHPRLRGGRLLPPQVCRMATSAAFNCPAGWQGRTVATGNIKVRLKDLALQETVRDSQPASRSRLSPVGAKSLAVIPCCYSRLRVRHASHD